MAYVARLFSGPNDTVEEVSHEFYDRVTLIDAGENTTQVTCSHCGRRSVWIGSSTWSRRTARGSTT